jgi:hypothetical protein
MALRKDKIMLLVRLLISSQTLPQGCSALESFLGRYQLRGKMLFKLGKLMSQKALIQEKLLIKKRKMESFLEKLAI